MGDRGYSEGMNLGRLRYRTIYLFTKRMLELIIERAGRKESYFPSEVPRRSVLPECSHYCQSESFVGMNPFRLGNVCINGTVSLSVAVSST